MTIRDYVKNMEKREDADINPIILLKINGKLSEITDDELKDGDNVEAVYADSVIGNECYRRSLSFLLCKAIYSLYGKNAGVILRFSLSKGVYCDLTGMKVDDAFIAAVKKAMLDDIAADKAFVKHELPLKKAAEIYENLGMEDKVKLIKYRRSSSVNLYSMDGYYDYFYGYMAASAGILKYFEIYPYEEGFVLQMPTAGKPGVVPAFAPQHKLYSILKEKNEWSAMLGLDTVGCLNDAISKGRINDLMLVQEARHEKKIVEIVDMIKQRSGVKFIMIAGPSSSGKTTFSHRLSVQLMANGFRPHPIAVDNYFVERDETPKDEFGEFDFECLEAVDVKLFNEHMTALLKGEKVEIPDFNFKLGRKEYNGNFLQLGDEDVLVIEGIHCLNDKLSYALPNESKFKIYISPLTQLSIDNHNYIPTTEGRLVRRLVRDYRTRGASAKRTLSMWASVRRGEEKNIFPYQEEADVMFNSSTDYELSILKSIAEPILFSVEEGEAEYLEAKKLLKFLNYFLPTNSDFVPINSITREFVGGGCFKV